MLVRASRTFVQAFLPPAAYLYTHSHTVSVTPVLASAALGASAAGISVLWNGLPALVGARKAKQLDALAEAVTVLVADAIAQDRAKQAATPPVVS